MVLPDYKLTLLGIAIGRVSGTDGGGAVMAYDPETVSADRHKDARPGGSHSLYTFLYLAVAAVSPVRPRCSLRCDIISAVCQKQTLASGCVFTVCSPMVPDTDGVGPPGVRVRRVVSPRPTATYPRGARAEM